MSGLPSKYLSRAALKMLLSVAAVRNKVMQERNLRWSGYPKISSAATVHVENKLRTGSEP